MECEKVYDLKLQQSMLKDINKILKNKITYLETTKIQETSSKNLSYDGLHYSLHSKFYVSVVIFGVVCGLSLLLFNPSSANDGMQTQYVIDNLRGDTVETWKSWRLIGNTMTVNIISNDNMSEDKLNIIKEAIISSDSIKIDNSLLQKGTRGTYSTYFLGWKGALDQVSSNKDTKYKLPENFSFISSDNLEGNVIIQLVTEKNEDGYYGYTRSTIDGNEILKSYITIFDVDALTNEELSAITRHEFGHALGLGHSTAPEDLMSPNVILSAPYISECNISAISSLYDGKLSDQVICDI